MTAKTILITIWNTIIMSILLPCSANSISRLPKSLSLISLMQKSLNPELFCCFLDLTGVSSSDKLTVKNIWYIKLNRYLGLAYKKYILTVIFLKQSYT